MDYKEENRNAYNKYPEDFNKKFEEHFYKYVKDKADVFIHQLKGNKVLDLGSGPGNHAIYFKNNGCDVICFDSSEAMLELCRRKLLRTQKGDIENIEYPAESFDGVWAYASLLHVPKEKIAQVLQSISKILKPEGIFQISLKEGQGEGMEENDKYPGTKRWFSYYTVEEIEQILKKHFKLLNFWRTKGSNTAFIHFMMKKS